MAQENTYYNLTQSGIIFTGAGVLEGFYINSTSSGAFQLRDALDASGAKLGGTITPAIGNYQYGNIRVGTGVYFQITAGTIDVTFRKKISD